MSAMRKQFQLTSLALAGMLGACGGNDGATEPAVEPATPTLSLSGTAASGAAIANKAVDARCAAGSGSATTGNDGSYTLTISNGALPCVLRTAAADGTVLHTLASGSGSGAVANITPATQLIVASLAGSDPAAYFAAFDATAASKVSAANIAAAQAAVVATLKAGGVDVGALGDLISSPLKPKTASAAGDAYDQALDKLAAALAAAGTTLATLAGTIATGSTVTPPSTSSNVASLPAELLLRPAAPHCAALRSGTYRVVSPTTTGQLSDEVDLLTVNAPAETSTDSDGSVSVLTPATDTCHYTTNAGKTDIVVSQAGVVVVRANNGGAAGPWSLAIAFPEQAHTLAEMAGTWNAIGMVAGVVAGSWSANAAHYTSDTAGNFASGALGCNNANWSLATADCQTVTPNAIWKANSAGGFDAVTQPSGIVYSRFFLYRAGNGDVMTVHIDVNGSFQLATHERTLILPTAGTVSSNWNVYLSASLFSTLGVDASAHVINSVDSVAQSYTRTSKTIGGTNDHSETLFANNPRNGYTWRQPATGVPAANGSKVNVNEFTSLGLRGMGLSALILPSLAPRQFDISVSQ